MTTQAEEIARDFFYGTLLFFMGMLTGILLFMFLWILTWLIPMINRGIA